MQIERVTSNAGPYGGTPYYFSAILYEDWEFWSPGPSGPIEQKILEDLALYHSVISVQIIKTYVPFVN